MDLRRRIPQAVPEQGFLQKLKNYDAYAKPLDDFRIKTTTGATVSIISFLLIMFLLYSEFDDWLRVEMVPSLQVDKSRKERMQINLNMTFPKVPCFMLSIDVMDVAGEHQNGVDHLMHKTRIDQHGNWIEKSRKELGDDHKELKDARNKTSQPGYCGSCYGAKEGCCNTCEQVREAYQVIGWSLENPDKFEQCKEEGYSKIIAQQSHEGCNIEGYLKVNKVHGNFHFAPGPSFELQGMHAHDLSDYRKHSKDWKFTHQIHHLSFGESRAFTNPLDGMFKTAEGLYNTYNYYIKVVSTEITYLNGTKVITNQYASTEHERDVSPKFGDMPTAMPGVFFNFDISPMLVKYAEYRKPFTHFLTDLCAIVGGVFTVAGMIDGILYTAERRLARKTEIGKQN